MTGSRPQWYNGILLLSSFFCCRLLWGTYQSIRVYQDVWAALHHDPLPPTFESRRGDADEMMRFAGHYSVPTWLAVVYLGSNIVLNTLNFYWFGKMIETIKKRFSEGKGGKGKEREEGVLVEGLMDSSTLITEVVDEGEEDKGDVKRGLVNGRSTVEVGSIQVRRRKD